MLKHADAVFSPRNKKVHIKSRDWFLTVVLVGANSVYENLDSLT